MDMTNELNQMTLKGFEKGSLECYEYPPCQWGSH